MAFDGEGNISTFRDTRSFSFAHLRWRSMLREDQSTSQTIPGGAVAHRGRVLISLSSTTLTLASEVE